jgi:hypothetical protein
MPLAAVVVCSSSSSSSSVICLKISPSQQLYASPSVSTYANADSTYAHTNPLLRCDCCCAGVHHFKTTYELAGPVAKLLPSLKPDQLATVVQALGTAGVNDLDLFKVSSSTDSLMFGTTTYCNVNGDTVCYTKSLGLI